MLEILTADSNASTCFKKRQGYILVGNAVTNGERFARAGVTSTIYQNLFRVILRVRWHDTLHTWPYEGQNDRTCIRIKIADDFDELCMLLFRPCNRSLTNYFNCNKFQGTVANAKVKRRIYTASSSDI